MAQFIRDSVFRPLTEVGPRQTPIEEPYPRPPGYGVPTYVRPWRLVLLVALAQHRAAHAQPNSAARVCPCHPLGLAPGRRLVRKRPPPLPNHPRPLRRLPHRPGHPRLPHPPRYPVLGAPRCPHRPPARPAPLRLCPRPRPPAQQLPARPRPPPRPLAMARHRRPPMGPPRPPPLPRLTPWHARTLGPGPGFLEKTLRPPPLYGPLPPQRRLPPRHLPTRSQRHPTRRLRQPHRPRP